MLNDNNIVPVSRQADKQTKQTAFSHMLRFIFHMMIVVVVVVVVMVVVVVVVVFIIIYFFFVFFSISSCSISITTSHLRLPKKL